MFKAVDMMCCLSVAGLGFSQSEKSYLLVGDNPGAEDQMKGKPANTKIFRKVVE
jgi:hypothetical protein